MILLDLSSSSDFPRSSDENFRTLSTSSWLSCGAAAVAMGPLSAPPPLAALLKDWGGVEVAVVVSAGPLLAESRRTRSVFGFGVRGGGGVLVSGDKRERRELAYLANKQA